MNHLKRWYVWGVVGLFVISIALTLITYVGKQSPLEYVETFSKDKNGTVFGVVMAAFFVYSLFFLEKKPVKSSKGLIAGWLLTVLILIAARPLFSMDVAAYLLSARNLVVHHANPYTTSLVAFLDTPWFSDLTYIWWMRFPSVYGPLFSIVLMAPLGWVVKSFSFIAAVQAYKFVVLTAYLASVGIFAKISRMKRDDMLPVLLYAFNPLILTNVLIDGHNDIFVMTFLLWGILLWKQKKALGSAAAFCASALIKYSTLLFVPIFFVRVGKILWKRIAIAALLGGAAALLLFSPSLGVRQTLNNPSLLPDNCLHICSPITGAIHMAVGVPKTEKAIRVGLFAIAYLGSAYLYLYKKHEPEKFMFWSFFGVLFILIRWVTPWYMAHLVPLALLVGNRKYDLLMLAITFFGIFSFFEYVK